MLDGVLRPYRVLKEILKQDERLLAAVFAPAVAAGVIDEDLHRWTQASCTDPADALVGELLLLSEYYQDVNPVLSAAIWGIWNSVNYLRRQRPIWLALFESRRVSRRAFTNIRALVATAVIQFADGDAHTVVTSSALVDMARYHANVERAIESLRQYQK
jgi:hypothetical protein